jgi:hypothetical protein
MKAMVKRYITDLYSQFHYYATWLPTSTIEVGSIGTFTGREFERLSHLRNEGIDFEIQEDTNQADLDYSSEGAVTISPKLSGKAPVSGSVLSEVDAGFTVDFSKKNAIVFRAKGVVCSSIKDQIRLGRDLKKKYDEGKWDKKWVVIKELVRAESATILISGATSSRVELKATANVGAAKLDIADASLSLNVAFEKNIGTKIVAEKGLTPLFKVRRGRER